MVVTWEECNDISEERLAIAPEAQSFPLTFKMGLRAKKEVKMEVEFCFLLFYNNVGRKKGKERDSITNGVIIVKKEAGFGMSEREPRKEM